jgi:hypothetical protein
VQQGLCGPTPLEDSAVDASDSLATLVLDEIDFNLLPSAVFFAH